LDEGFVPPDYLRLAKECLGIIKNREESEEFERTPSREKGAELRNPNIKGFPPVNAKTFHAHGIVPPFDPELSRSYPLYQPDRQDDPTPHLDFDNATRNPIGDGYTAITVPLKFDSEASKDSVKELKDILKRPDSAIKIDNTPRQALRDILEEMDRPGNEQKNSLSDWEERMRDFDDDFPNKP